MHVPPIAALELHRIVDTALARGCDVILTIARDGHEYSVRVRNTQVIETVGKELSEAA
jgi:hypothetical protein